MNEADRTPSPSRFCRMFGIRNAALNASVARLLPKNAAIVISRIKPATRDRAMPEATITDPREDVAALLPDDARPAAPPPLTPPTPSAGRVGLWSRQTVFDPA